MSLHLITRILTKFGLIPKKSQSPAPCLDSKETLEKHSIPTSMQQNSQNWPDPKDLIQSELNMFELVKQDRLKVSIDRNIWLSYAAQRIQLLSLLLQEQGGKWVGNSQEIYGKLVPDLDYDPQNNDNDPLPAMD